MLGTGEEQKEVRVIGERKKTSGKNEMGQSVEIMQLLQNKLRTAACLESDIDV